MSKCGNNTVPAARRAARSGVAGWVAAASALCLVLAWPVPVVRAAADIPQHSDSAQQVVAVMLANEDLAAQHIDHYTYLSQERSDRTGGHLWTEKVVETNLGKVRMLLAEDGRPLSPERIAEERGRLAAIVADPAAFARRSQAIKDDELHSRQMLKLVSRAFLFGSVHPEGGYLRIDYRPNPDYQPQSMEERVLHAMSGTLLIDPAAMRLHHIEGRLPEDVNIGFGLLATIHAGSNFATTRDRLGQPDWKTTQVDTAINGKVIFFKSIARNEHAEHSNFVRVPNNLTVSQAVAIAEQP